MYFWFCGLRHVFTQWCVICQKVECSRSLKLHTSFLHTQWSSSAEFRITGRCDRRRLRLARIAYPVIAPFLLFPSSESITAKILPQIPFKSCSAIKISSTHHRLRIGGDVCYLQSPCCHCISSKYHPHFFVRQPGDYCIGTRPAIATDD